MKTKIVTFGAVFLSLCTYSQNINRIEKQLRKEDFEKARKLLFKSWEKDSTDIALNYYFSIYYMSDSAFQSTDTARILINRALNLYDSASEAQLKDFSKNELAKDSLLDQKKIVTASAFTESVGEMTVASMDYFLDHYPDAIQRSKANHIRDSLAFDEAKRTDSWESYKRFMDLYPYSEYYKAALGRYQVLIYQVQTQDNSLQSYIRFLEQNPLTPFRREAEEIILKKSTTAHNWESYLAFLERYPETHLKKKIGDVLYYLDRSNGRKHFERLISIHPSPDSLRAIFELENLSLFPIMNQSGFGFNDLDGNLVIDPKYDSIGAEYKCGHITTQWIRVFNDDIQSVINRRGDHIMSLSIDRVEEVDASVMLVVINGLQYLYHGSGYQIYENSVKSAELIDNRWIRIEVKDQKYGLISILGQEILPPIYQSLNQVGAFIVAEQGDYYGFSTPNLISEIMNGDSPFSDFKFDDYDIINDTLLLAFQDKQESLYDHRMDLLIPLAKQEIFVMGAAWYARNSNGYQLYNRDKSEFLDQTFSRIEVNNGWIAIKRDLDWILVSQTDALLPMRDIDSVKLINDEVVFIMRGDTSFLQFTNGYHERMYSDQHFYLLKSHSNEDAKQFIKIKSSLGIQVLDGSGREMLNARFDEVEYLNDTLFKVQTRRKTGIMDTKKNLILKMEYDVIDEKEGLVFLLRGGRIGCLDLYNQTLISPKYQSRIVKLGNAYLVTENNQMGLIDQSGDELFPVEYEEIREWNDTTYWLRKEDNWELTSVSGTVYLEQVQALEPYFETPAEIQYKVAVNHAYGIISNLNGTIMPIEFNDIRNLGLTTKPVYMGEQFLEFANFYVISYVTTAGNLLTSDTYRPSSYFKMVCE